MFHPGHQCVIGILDRVKLLRKRIASKRRECRGRREVVATEPVDQGIEPICGFNLPFSRN